MSILSSVLNGLTKLVKMSIEYPNIDFQRESKLHPRHKDMEDDMLNWLLNEYKLEDCTKLRNHVSLTIFVSRIYSNAEWSERLIQANRMGVLWFMLDDVFDEKDFKYGSGKNLDSDLLDKSEPEQDVHPLVRANNAVMRQIRATSPESWWKKFRQDVDEHFFFAHATKKVHDNKGDFTYIEFVRWLNVGGFPFFRLIEYVNNSYLTPPIRVSTLVHYLDHFALRVATYYNEYVSFEKEYGHGAPDSIVIALKKKHGGSYQDAILALKDIIDEDMRVFLKVAEHCFEMFKGEQSMRVYAEGLHVIIQGNKDYSDDVYRYPRGILKIADL